MPQRVTPEYVPYSTVRPMGPRDPTEHVSINFPEVRISDAVGRAMGSVGEHGFGALAGAQGAVARAFDNLGGQLEKTGNQLWERAQGLQELQNQNALSKAELEFDKYVATKKSQFENNKGEAATEDTYKAYVKDLEDQAKKLGEKLPPRTLEQYNKSTRNQIGHAGIAAAGHVASEIRKVTIETSEARVNQFKDELSKNRDLNKNQEIIEKIEKEIHGVQAPTRGWSKPVADEAVRKHVGEGYIAQLLDLSRTDPWQALKILEHPDNKGLWDDKQYLAAKTRILAERDHIVSRNIANDVQTTNPDGNMEEKVEEGKKRAKEEYPDAPDLPDKTGAAIKERHHTHKTAVEEQRRDNNEKVWHILDGKMAGTDGVKPKNRDQLFAMGGDEARAAYWALPQKDRDKVEEQMRKIALGVEPPSAESEAIKDMMWGMAEEDRARFRDMDLNHVDGLRLADKNRLKEEQKKIRREGVNLEADPRIGRALNDAKNAGIIDKKLMENKNAFTRFKGAFREAIIVAQKEKGYDKPLTEEEHKQIADMVKSKIDLPGAIWGEKWKTPTPIYDIVSTVPKAVQDRLRKDVPGISDEAILSEYRREYMLNKWNELFKGKK